MNTDINKTISTINNLSKVSVGEIETAMRAIRRTIEINVKSRGMARTLVIS